jgi:hypothetical protein
MHYHQPSRRKLDSIVVLLLCGLGIYALARLPLDFFSHAVLIFSLALVGAISAARLWYE